MRKLAVSGHFQKQLKKLHRQDQEKVTAALKTFLGSLQKGNSPAGLGFKKINGDKYEIRVDLRNRIVMKLDGDTFVCHLVGNHEAVKRYLRDYRNR